ncbi:MAG: glycerate kinase [Elusimicrobia bacterium]|nr:glycerate kinase [Elusimicrobiota bacterium]
MRIVIAPDSFKESLSAENCCKAIQKGIKKIFPDAATFLIPMADGGEGTLSCLFKSIKGKIIRCKVHDPLNRKIIARYGIMENGKTALIEMAEASGLPLIPPKKRNPMITTSFGAGELIRAALEKGCKKIILTLGGVATNDAAVGMAQALGFRFLDKKGREIPKGADGLKFLDRIDTALVHPKLKKTEFFLCCDVKNPLCGKNGSAQIYGPQKGASPKMVKEIDKNLFHLAKIIKKDLGKSILKKAGAGAAGGAGGGAMAFFNGKVQSGIETVIELTNLEEKIKAADLVITGEGKIDRQTLFGKTVAGVATLAKKQHVPVIAFCGQISGDMKKLHELGINTIFSIASGPVSYNESLNRTSLFLQRKTEEVMRLLKIFIK